MSTPKGVVAAGSAGVIKQEVVPREVVEFVFGVVSLIAQEERVGL